MHYCADVTLAFSSIARITRDVNYGFLLKYFHVNGALAFFYAFTFILQGTYTMEVITFDLRHHLWFSGIKIFLIMVLTAFIGYILPWDQMSFWGATVITNSLSAIPYIGTDIVQWVWGVFSVNNAASNRFFSLHYLFPFILAGLILIHLVLLHTSGSNSPTRLKANTNKTPFYIYFITRQISTVL